MPNIISGQWLIGPTEHQSGNTGGNDRHDPIPREFFHEQISQAGFIDYNGKIEVHNSLSAFSLTKISLNPGASERDLSSGLQDLRTAMIAIAKVISLAFPASSPEAEVLKAVAIFCGVGLFVSLCLASYGLDLGSDFFLIMP
jgi:hypothetical protein